MERNEMRTAIKKIFTPHKSTPRARDTSPAHREYSRAHISYSEARGEYYAEQRPNFGAPPPTSSRLPPALSERERHIRDAGISDVLSRPSATQFGTIHAPDYATIQQAARMTANRSIEAARDSWYTAHPYAPADSMPTDITYRLAARSAEYTRHHAQIEAERRHRAAGEEFFPYG